MKWVERLKEKVKSIDWGGWLYQAKRNRTTIIYGGAVVGIGLLFATDPTPGHGSTLAMLVGAIATIVGVALSHICRKGIFDYKDADMSELFKKAAETPSGSGMALIAISIVMASFLMLFSGFANAGEPSVSPPYATIEEQVVSGVHPKVAEWMLIPAKNLAPGASVAPAPALAPPSKAAPHLGTVVAQVGALWPDHPHPAYIGGLIEHESCLSLTHSRCWNEKSRLKTEKEEGAGLGQFHQSMES